jgi:hypothetical protein
MQPAGSAISERGGRKMVGREENEGELKSNYVPAAAVCTLQRCDAVPGMDRAFITYN